MTTKLDYSKWDKEINDLSLSSRKAAEAIEARTGDKVIFVLINKERKRRGLDVSKGGSSSTVKAASPVVEVQVAEKPRKAIEGEQLTIAGAELAELPTKEQKRSTIAGAVAVANSQEVETARSIVGGLMSLEAVAAALGITKRSAIEYVRGGRLKAIKVGAKWKVSPDNLRKFIEGE